MRTLTKELRRLRASIRAAQRGYVIILTALLLLPLVIVTAFAVDLGAWQVRGAELQRTADAAALAGVVELPDQGAAGLAARQVVEQNGFDLADYDVTVTPILDATSNSARLQVRILERTSDRYFSGVVLDDQTLARQATAEFIRPVKLGSPKNYLGTGDELGGANRENVWLAISGYCASREQGERIAAYSDANFTTWSNPPGGGNSFASCLPGSEGGPSYVEANPEYDADGYFYVVNLKEDYSGTLDIRIFDAPYCRGGASGAGDQSGEFATTYTVRANDAFDPANATVLRRRTLNPSSDTSWRTGWCNRWVTLHTLVNPDAGQYYVQVQNEVGVTGQQGTNQFSLRVDENGTFSPCTSDPSTASSQSPFRSNCPGVHGLENMGAFANFSGSQPSFFLAELGAEHNNKTMEITLWDMGEGTERLRILDPLGNRATFRYTVLCNDGTEPSGGTCPGETNPTGGRSGTTNNLNTSGSNHPQPGPHRLSSSRYNDRLMRLEIDLPADIEDAYGGNTWWRVQYQTGGSPSDRTTWSVIVRGDPVRLVP